MSTDVKQDQELDPGFVRDQLDEILAQEITALLQNPPCCHSILQALPALP